MAEICKSHSSVSFTLANNLQSVLFNRSTILFVWGWYADKNLCVIKNFLHKILTVSLIKFRPWSDKIIFGVLYLHIISSNMNFARVRAPVSGTALASSHLVK